MMKSWDFEAITYDGVVYCLDCLPQGVCVDSPEVYPIFADEEWSIVPVCEKCGRVHDYITVLSNEEE